MDKRRILRQQLNVKFAQLPILREMNNPPSGWVSAVRNALGITLEQLGRKLGVSKQNILELEKREITGNITLRNLRNVADALDMQLVYGFIPKDTTLDALIERKAKEKAIEIVMRTHQTMMLEAQEISRQKIELAISEKTEELKMKIPKFLWD